MRKIHTAYAAKKYCAAKGNSDKFWLFAEQKAAIIIFYLVQEGSYK